jgi:hypothetical protein
MTNMLEAATQAIQAIDQASRQGDRWLFIAALVVLGTVVTFIVRFLTRQNSRLINDHAKARDSYQDALNSIVNAQAELTKQIAVTLDRNTCVLHEVEQELRLRRQGRGRPPPRDPNH